MAGNDPEQLYRRRDHAARSSVEVDTPLPFESKPHVFHHLPRIHLEDEEVAHLPAASWIAFFRERPEGDGAEKPHLEVLLRSLLTGASRDPGARAECNDYHVRVFRQKRFKRDFVLLDALEFPEKASSCAPLLPSRRRAGS